jgi:FkbM family methyltransferase
LTLVAGRKLLRNTPLQKTKIVTFFLSQLMKRIGSSQGDDLGIRVLFRGEIFQMEPEDISILPSVLIGNYEQKELDFICEKITGYLTTEKKIAVVDVGSNVGLYAVTLGRILRQGDHIIAVEPDPRNLKLLKHNMLIAKILPSLEIHEAVVSSSNGPVNLLLAKYAGVSRISKYREENTTQVKSITLDSLFANVARDSKVICKIDVEGFESDVISSGIDSILEYKPDLLIEFGQVEDLQVENRWGRNLRLLFANYSEILYFLDDNIISVNYEEFVSLATKAKLGNLWLSH